MNELVRMIEEEGRAEGLQQGREEGREEGRVEGRSEGQAELLWVLLTQRWGALPAEARAKIIMLAGTPGAAGQLAALGNVTTRDEVLRRLELT